MRKRIITLSIATLALVAVCVISRHTLFFNMEESSLLSQNIEALTDGDNPYDNDEKCSRVTETASCINNEGKWICVRIVSVERYQRTSLVQRCDQARITFCPPGTREVRF